MPPSEASFDTVHLDLNEPVSALLHRMQLEQNRDTARAQYPSEVHRDPTITLFAYASMEEKSSQLLFLVRQITLRCRGRAG